MFPNLASCCKLEMRNGLVCQNGLQGFRIIRNVSMHSLEVLIKSTSFQTKHIAVDTANITKLYKFKYQIQLFRKSLIPCDPT